MNAKNIFIKGIIILILSILPIGIFVTVMDPYQFFKSDDIYLSQERYQIAGLARNKTYDSIIVGTSMVENFLDSEVSEKLNSKTMKLPINASYITEQGMVIDMAIKHNDVKEIMWNIDYRCLDIDYGQYYEKEIEFPYYMYDEKIYNDWKYIINHSNLYLATKKLFYKNDGYDRFNEFKTDLDKLNTWYEWQTFDRQLLLEDYNGLKSGERDLSQKLNFKTYDDIKKVIDLEVLERLRKYDDVEFHITFPPKSILWYRLLDEKGLLDNKEKVQLYLLKETEKLPNVKVYNFQNVYDIVENFDIYHDINHYNKMGNDYMIDSIVNKKHITNVDQYIKESKDLRKHMYSNKINDSIK